MSTDVRIQGLRQVISRFNSLSADVQDELNDALDISLRDVKSYAQHNHRFISRTGTTERSIDSEASYGKNFKGTVSTRSKIAIYQHEGTRAHLIKPKNKTVLRWTNGRSFAFSRRVKHPGIKKDQFIYEALEHEKTAIISRFEQAIHRAVQEME